MKFREDINGLRAVAVAAVVLFHFSAPLLPGGFVGVDVFFVISGFLMAGIIYTKLSKGNFSLGDFYLARSRRIIPALLFLCLVLMPVGWVYLSGGGFQLLVRHIAGSLTFLSNFIYWSESGYFGSDSHEKWLLHTWSLSIEWQFYLVFPIILTFCFKVLGANGARLSVLALFLVSLAYSVFYSDSDPEGAYFNPAIRAWQLLLGALVYLYPIKLADRSRMVLSYLGLFLILVSSFAFSEEDIWPGYLALLPAMGVAVVIWSNYSGNLVLNNRLSSLIGRWSYSIYLWHWPVVVLLYAWNPFYSGYFVLLGLGLSVVCGYLSYTVVERKPFTMAHAISGILPFMLVVALTPLKESNVTLRDDDAWQYFEEKYRDYSMDSGGYWKPCNAKYNLVKHGELRVDDLCFREQGPGGVLLWGDSHAGAISPAVRSALAPGTPFYQLASPGCGATVNDERRRTGTSPSDLACNFTNDTALQVVKRYRPAVVIVAKQRSHEKYDWGEFAKVLKDLGVARVILIGPVPQWKPSLPVALKNAERRGHYIASKALDPRMVKTSTILMERYGSHPDLVYIDLISQLCHRENEKLYCLANVSEEELLVFDYGHLTSQGATYVVTEFLADAMDTPDSLVSINKH